ncbi:MAG TPA: alpha-hydroxy-acid oxidizing protein [Terriglobia bacterium]|nr:alpha-hydroxy-acid oxidizing protein [Terriglobia bacterium]
MDHRTPSPASRPYGLERQTQIFAGGPGADSGLPISVELREEKARAILSPRAYDFVRGGAGSEDTCRANLAAFRRWRIVPRMFRDVSRRDLSVELLGLSLPAPVLLAPIGVQSIVHPEAELAVARAAASLGIPFVLSTAASRPLEAVAEACGRAPAWYQLYWSRDPEMTASLVVRAERAGYKAIVVTLDANLLGWRERDLSHPYLPFLDAEGLANYFSDPVFRGHLARPPEEDPAAALRYWSSVYSHTSLTWDDLRFLRRHTRLPVLLKGILHPEDAALAVRYGVDGIIVSNHGGRQVDGAVAALDALPAIVDAVRAARSEMPVLFDSGIRRGADAVIALALGARAVLLGRLFVWGLAIAGEQGVRETLLNFLADFDLTLALSGYRSPSELSPSALVREAA